MHLNKPVNQHSPHMLADFCLKCKIVSFSAFAVKRDGGQKILLNLSTIEFFLTQRFNYGFELRWLRKIRAYILISWELGIIFMLDMTQFAKFHSK